MTNKKEIAKEASATAVAASALSLARAVTEEVTKRPQSSERGRNGFLETAFLGYTTEKKGNSKEWCGIRHVKNYLTLSSDY